MTTVPAAVGVQREPELLGQTVVVIGGSAGIGLETARKARTEGAEVVLTGRNPDRLAQAAQELRAQRTRRSTPPTRTRWSGTSRTCQCRSTM